MSTILICPACDRPVTMFSDDHAFKVCACRNVLKYNGGIQLANLMAIPQFPELIQPGTTGKWKNEKFTVSGRVQVQLDESVMNFWDLRTDRSNGYLLMEGYGLYAILEKSEQAFADTAKTNYSLLEPGKQIKWNQDSWLLEEREKLKNFQFEGEIRLPQTIVNGQIFSFASPKGGNYLVVEWAPNKPVTYLFHATGFDELDLNTLRTPQPSSKAFFCQVCNRELPVTLFPYSNSVVCSSCQVQHSWQHNNGFVKRKGIDYRLKPTIAIGAEGSIKGARYRVTGYSEKEEINSTDTFWREYTLYNAQYGFAYLSEYNGHWTFLRQEPDAPVLLEANTESFELAKESFVQYNSYKAKVRSAEGEFPYDIFDDKSVEIKEFISPPEIWSREFEKDKGFTWFHGEYIKGEAVREAFSLTDMPQRLGIGALQPTGYMSTYKLFMTWLMGIGLLLLVHSSLMFGRHDKTLFQTDHVFLDTAKQHTIITPKFELDRNLSNIAIDINAPVSNSWFELDATLVNTVTGTEYSQEKGVEYYSGYTNGESWKEGSTNAQIWFNAVPKGTYLLQLQGIRPTTSDAVDYFTVEVKYDVPGHRNFWWIALFWSVVVLIKAIIQYNVEARRWDPATFVAENGKSLRYAH